MACHSLLVSYNVVQFFGKVNGSSSLVSEYLGKVIDNVEGETIEVNNVRQLLVEQAEEVPWAVQEAQHSSGGSERIVLSARSWMHPL